MYVPYSHRNSSAKSFELCLSLQQLVNSYEFNKHKNTKCTVQYLVSSMIKFIYISINKY